MRDSHAGKNQSCHRSLSLGALGLTAVSQKDPGRKITVPKVEVTKTQEGDVTLPKYDVKTLMSA